MLQLNTPSTRRPILIIWDVNDKKQVADVARDIEALKKDGFKLLKIDRTGGEAELQPPGMPEDSIVFRVLSENGDDRLLWDRKDPEQIKEARAKFDEYVGKGHTPYACRGDGKPGAKVDTFDPLHEEIIFVPKTKPS